MADTVLDWLPPAITGGVSARELAAGETLFRQGDAATAIFVVVEGRLRLVRHTIDHRKIVIYTARPGDLFAEAALFASAYHCDAIADVRSKVRVVRKRQMLAALRSNPRLAESFIAVLAREIQMLRSRLEQRSIRSARERVLQYLALTASADGRTVRLSGTLMDLAAEIGLTHESLYRTLAALEREGAIARTPEAVVLKKRRAV